MAEINNSRHQCYECDWIYSQALGWLEDGIVAGTTFADIPTGWSCPDCGADQQAFQLISAVSINPQQTAPTQAASFSAWDAPEKKRDTAAAATAAVGFSVWECLVCGWLYDEAKGWPEDGIAPGTKWQDIPADWLCPECGVGKDDFDMVRVANSAGNDGMAAAAAVSDYQIDPDLAPLIIIGTGLAAYNLAREWRKHNHSQALIMVTRDDGALYSKPLLSTGYSKNKRADQLVIKTAEQMAQELAADIRIYSEVTSIDSVAQILHISDVQLHYSKLVFATGASCIEAPLAGNALDAVYKINDLLDYQRLRTALVGKKKLLLIGAGLIGCEYANDLANGGFEIEVVEPMPTVLASLLPPEASYAVLQGLAKLGVKHHFGTVVKSIDRKTEGLGVCATLANGEQVEVDAVLSAIGVRANTQLAAAAGLAVNRGIVVDRSLKTSVDNIYALGDCAEVDGHLLYFIEPLMQGAKALAQTLNGDLQAVLYGAMPVAIKTPSCPTVVAPPPRGAEGEWRVMGEGLNIRAVFKSPQNQTLGFALTGSAVELRRELEKQLPATMS